VARAVYLHGLASALLAWLMWQGFVTLSAWCALATWSAPTSRGYLLLLAVPCAAGLLLCACVGDPRRGMLSAAALFAFLPAHILFNVAVLLGRWPLDGALTANAALLLILAVAGGLPPLVHLLRPRPAC
jgi:hypothetical protein